MIRVDGINLNTATDNPSSGRAQGRQGFDLATLPLERVQSIEILRGAASSIYGPDATAGVVLIRTKRPRKPSVLLERTVGAGGFRESEVEWVRPYGDTTLTVNANHRKSSGEYLFFDPTLAQPGATTTTPGAEVCAPDQGGGFRLRRCNAREVSTLALGLNRGADQRWSLELQRSRREGSGGVLDSRPFGREEEQRYAFGYTDAWHFLTEDQLGVNLNTLRIERERTENTGVESDQFTGAQRDIQATGELWYDNWIATQRYRYGAALHRQELEDRSFSAARDRRSAYVHWTWHQERGTLEGSLRRDEFSDVVEFSDVSERSTYRLGQSTYRLGLSRFLGDTWGIKASRGTGYRPPTLYELFDPGSFSGAPVSNPELVPEDSVSSDGGLFIESSGKYYGELLYFEQNLRNDIVAIADPSATSQFRLQNVFRTRSTGWEAAFNIRFATGLSLDVSWTVMKAIILENDRDDPRDNGNRVPGVPERQGSAAVSWHKDGWRLYVNARYSDRRFIDSANSRFLQSYLVVDGGWGFPLAYGFSGNLEGKNLTNETYAELENFPPPGRQLFFTLRWRYPPQAEQDNGDEGERGDSKTQ